MKVFTYNQYIKFIHRVRLNAVLQVAEQSSKYNLEKNKDTEEDKKEKNSTEEAENEARIQHNICFNNKIKEILKDCGEVSELINTFLNPKRITKAEELHLYENSHINKKYSSKEWMIIYKHKNKPIFYLLRNQMYIDSEFNYKILNICVDIIQSWSKNYKKDFSTEQPLIVPIIIYTGSEMLKKCKTKENSYLGNYILEKNQINMECNIIDINKISKELLMQNNTMFCKTVLEHCYYLEDDLHKILLKCTPSQRKFIYNVAKIVAESHFLKPNK